MNFQSQDDFITSMLKKYLQFISWGLLKEALAASAIYYTFAI